MNSKQLEAKLAEDNPSNDFVKAIDGYQQPVKVADKAFDYALTQIHKIIFPNIEEKSFKYLNIHANRFHSF